MNHMDYIKVILLWFFVISEPQQLQSAYNYWMEKEQLLYVQQNI